MIQCIGKAAKEINIFIHICIYIYIHTRYMIYCAYCMYIYTHYLAYDSIYLIRFDPCLLELLRCGQLKEVNSTTHAADRQVGLQTLVYQPRKSRHLIVKTRSIMVLGVLTSTLNVQAPYNS